MLMKPQRWAALISWAVFLGVRDSGSGQVMALLPQGSPLEFNPKSSGW